MMNRKSYGAKADKSLRAWAELCRAHKAVRSREMSFIEPKGLTLHQFGVLEALYHLGTLSVGEITKLVLSTPGNMTVVIKKLTEKGLAKAVPSDRDRRKTLLKITDEGEALIAGMFPKHAENMTEYFSCLSGEEMDVLKIILRKLSKSNRKSINKTA
jgi:MarR family 2-MHQ and catechol resistance regulon transcriptional repressor